MPTRLLPCTAPPSSSSPSSYDGDVDSMEPTVLWRLVHPEGRHARAILLPGAPQLTLTFFVDSVMDRAENFDSMDVALFRSDEIKRLLLADGWKEDE